MMERLTSAIESLTASMDSLTATVREQGVDLGINLEALTHEVITLTDRMSDSKPQKYSEAWDKG